MTVRGPTLFGGSRTTVAQPPLMTGENWRAAVKRERTTAFNRAMGGMQGTIIDLDESPERRRPRPAVDAAGNAMVGGASGSGLSHP